MGNAEAKRRTATGHFKHVSNGTSTHVVASFDPEIASQNGSYLLNCRLALPEEVRSGAYDPVQAEKLWKLSEEIVGQKFA